MHSVKLMCFLLYCLALHTKPYTELLFEDTQFVSEMQDYHMYLFGEYMFAYMKHILLHAYYLTDGIICES